MSRRRGKGKPAYWCNNKIVRARETFHLQTCRGGKTLYKIQERKLRVRDAMAIEHDFTIKENGEEIVKVHKNWISPIKDCYFIDIHGTDDVALALMTVIGLEAMSGDD